MLSQNSETLTQNKTLSQNPETLTQKSKTQNYQRNIRLAREQAIAVERQGQDVSALPYLAISPSLDLPHCLSLALSLPPSLLLSLSCCL